MLPVGNVLGRIARSRFVVENLTQFTATPPRYFAVNANVKELAIFRIGVSRMLSGKIHVDFRTRKFEQVCRIESQPINNRSWAGLIIQTMLDLAKCSLSFSPHLATSKFQSFRCTPNRRGTWLNWIFRRRSNKIYYTRSVLRGWSTRWDEDSGRLVLAPLQ